MQLHTYLNYGGNCEEAFEQPAPTDVPPEWKNKADRFQPIRSAYLSLTVGSIDETEREYALLSDGGQIFMPMEETFFANRFAMLRDRFGTSWMLLYPKPSVA